MPPACLCGSEISDTGGSRYCHKCPKDRDRSHTDTRGSKLAAVHIPFPGNLPGWTCATRLKCDSTVSLIVSARVTSCALFVTLVATGCVGTGIGTLSSENASVRADAAPLPVIALLDTGVTPYLPILAFEGSTAMPPVAFEEVGVTLGGSFQEDRSVWEALDTSTLYHFRGTRLLAISFGHPPEFPPIMDSNGHGTGTSYVAAREAPDAVIVMVQANVRYCTDRTDCFLDPSIAEAMEWIAHQEWIDIVSVSLGPLANFPDPSPAHPEAARFAAATREAATTGKVVVIGAGNAVSPTLYSYLAGPPWVIAVGGFEASRNGETVLSSKGIDVVANFSEIVPYSDNGEMVRAYGTSLGAPNVAGVLATAFHIAWRSDTSLSISPERARSALNASARLVDAEDWDPRPVDHGSLLSAYPATSLPAISPHQVGWGYVDGTIAPVVAELISSKDDRVLRSKPVQDLFQSAWQRSRESYWSATIVR